jgi:hypothetical protein
MEPNITCCGTPQGGSVGVRSVRVKPEPLCAERLSSGQARADRVSSATPNRRETQAFQ